MTDEKREQLRIAQEICDEEERSTEYMIAFMQDFAECSFDEVMEFLKEEAEND